MTGTVRIRRLRFAADLEPSSPAVAALVRRLVPPAGREPGLKSGTLLIHDSRVGALLAALRAKGVRVVEENPA